MRRNPVQNVSVDMSANVCSCVRRSLDNQLCIREIPDLANNASRVAVSVSLERDSHRAPPLERVISLSVPQLVPPPKARHHQVQNRQPVPHLDDGCIPLQPMMVQLHERHLSVSVRGIHECFISQHCKAVRQSALRVCGKSELLKVHRENLIESNEC